MRSCSRSGVRELRLLVAHAPPYNRRSRFPQRWWWVVLTDEPFPPDVGGARKPRTGQVVGPFRSRADAADTATLIARFTGVRTCTNRIGRNARHGPACPEREVAPCPAASGMSAADYAEAPRRAAALIAGTDSAALAAAVDRIADLAARRRYESAARLRDATAATVETFMRGQRLRTRRRSRNWSPPNPTAPVVGCSRWSGMDSWPAAGRARRGMPPMPVVESLRSAAQVVLPKPGPLGGALVEETALITRWLSQPGVRIVCATEGFASPVHSAGQWQGWAATSARTARLVTRLGGCTPPRPPADARRRRNRVPRRSVQPLLPGRQPFGVAG